MNWCHGHNRSGLLLACPKSGNVPVARASEVRDVSALYQAGQMERIEHGWSQSFSLVLTELIKMIAALE